MHLIVLTRSSNRPKFFLENRKSLKLAAAHGAQIINIVSYDDQQTFEYVQQEKLIKSLVPLYIVPVVRQERTKPAHFPYNLYCNQMQQKVLNLGLNGWIMYLDDDDVFVDEKSANTIISYCQKATPNDLILWKVKFPDRIAPSERFFGKTVRPTGFSAIGVAYHSKWCNQAIWDDRRGGDGRLIYKISQLQKKEGGQIYWIDKILTTINYDNGCGGFGRRQDKECG